MKPRQELDDNVDTGGVKVRALDNEPTPKFRFKTKNN